MMKVTRTNNNPFSQIVFLFGPTGVGKTSLLTKLCKDQFTVINADSVQVYKGLDIGSAKVSQEQMKLAPHKLIDILQPWEQFSVAKFIDEADKAVEAIAADKRIPILSGGTAYYFKHFYYGLSDAPKSNEETRRHVAAWIEKVGLAAAREKLKEIDPISYNKIAANDSYRIARALEVFEDSGKPRSSFGIPTTPRHDMNPLIIGLKRSPEEMERRMRLRFSLMMEAGLLDEVRKLIREGAKPDWPGMQGIGYREFFSAIENGEDSLSSIGDAIVRNSRLYAKRQLTFFKSFANVHWIDAENEEEVIKLVNSYVQA